jgi:hypothetical protein
MRLERALIRSLPNFCLAPTACSRCVRQPGIERFHLARSLSDVPRHSTLRTPSSRARLGARAVIGVGLAGIGLIHLLDAIGKYRETRYVFWMYIALILGSLATAGAVLVTRTRAAFRVAAGLAASAAAGYVLSRTTSLPSAGLRSLPDAA